MQRAPAMQFIGGLECIGMNSVGRSGSKDALTKKCDLAYSVFNRLNPQGTI